MDTRRLITAMLAAFAVFYLWLYISPHFFPPPPPTEPSDEERLATTRPATATATATAPGEMKLASAPAPASAASVAQIDGGDSTAPLRLGDASRESFYPMALEISPRGASVTKALVRGYYDSLENKEPYPILMPVIPGDDFDTSAQLNSFVTTRVLIESENRELSYDLDRVIWKVKQADGETAVFFVELKDSQNQQLVRVIKAYHLAKQSMKDKTFNLGLSLRFENLTEQNLKIKLVQQGPIGFRQEEARGEDRRVVMALWRKDRTEPIISSHNRGEVMKDKNDKIILGGDTEEQRIAWVAQTNQYFACIMTPAGRTGLNDPPRFTQANAIHLTGMPDKAAGLPHERQDLTFVYITDSMTVPAGQAKEVAFDCFIGPKSKKVFDTVEVYKQLGYYGVISVYFYACAPNAVATFMMTLLNLFHRIPPHNYGIAIILLVLLVRLILHPVTKKSQVNMMRMQKQVSVLQPKINAVREKYANDRQAMNQAMMQVYREAGVNPAGQMLTCLPMMLQIPIWAGLWAGLSSLVDMRHAPFDGFWIKDLTAPDALFHFAQQYDIPLLSGMIGPVKSFNLLPILLGISQILQARFMPRGNPQAASSGNPDQLEQQRKMMIFMSIIFVLILYNAPSGLNLYIMVSNFCGIFEQWRIREHLKQDDERERLREKVAKDQAPRQKGYLLRKWEEFQKHAEAAQRVQGRRLQEKRDKKKD